MKRAVLGLVVLGIAAVGATSALASTKTAPVPTCVVVNGPSNLTVQVGYAPNGPSDCQQLP